MTYPKVFANDVEEVRMNHRAAYLESKAAREEYKEAILAENVNPAMSRDYRTLSVQSDYEIAAHQAVRQAYSRLFSVVGADNL
ncbi:hypothetical protein [Streptomyces canus]|nr:hypothetical protein [Streptomyces canus]